MKRLCFVLIPLREKPDPAGPIVDPDALYGEVIEPAIRDAGLDPYRAEKFLGDGTMPKPMWEQLLLYEFAVIDLSGANSNVLYHLGIRQAVRPGSTVCLYSEFAPPRFDVVELHALPYRVAGFGVLESAAASRRAIADQLRLAQAPLQKSSPVLHLVDTFRDIARLTTDVFRDRAEYSTALKERLAEARKQGVEGVRKIDGEIGDLEGAEFGVVVDLFLSYRAVKGWAEMVTLVKRMPAALAATTMVQQQLALALNRAGQGEQAERVLNELLTCRGPSSETYGILGRVLKDRADLALKTGSRELAEGLLNRAITAYLKGFETDWRDAYPGINAITLMELKEPPDPLREKLIPVVAYAVERRIVVGKPDYWDHATRFELAVLARDEKTASAAIAEALAAVREVWELQTTVRNVRLIREARASRGDSVPWADRFEQALIDRANKWSTK